MDEITISDKIYISSKRAAEVTGYAKDYVGQLCRGGFVDSKMVGRSWYVYEPSIRAHRFGTDAIQPHASQEVFTEPLPEAESIQIATKAPIEPPSQAHEEEPTQRSSTWNQAIYTSEAPQMIPELKAPAYQELLPPPEETLMDMQSAWQEWFDRTQKTLQTPEIESAEVIDARASAHEEEIEREDEIEAQDLTPVAENEEEIEATDESDEDESEVEIPLRRVQEENREEERVPAAYERQPSAPSYYAEEQTVPIQAIQSIRPAYATREAPGRRYTEQAREAKDIRYDTGSRIIEERIIKKSAKESKTSSSNRSTRMSTNAPVVALLIGVSVLAITIGFIGSGFGDRYVKSLQDENTIVNFLAGTRVINK